MPASSASAQAPARKRACILKLQYQQRMVLMRAGVSPASKVASSKSSPVSEPNVDTPRSCRT
ncbi:hypothetical protein ACN28S_18675 [Cystobacter fuscus]